MPSIRARLDILSPPDLKIALTTAWAAPETRIITLAVRAGVISGTASGSSRAYSIWVVCCGISDTARQEPAAMTDATTETPLPNIFQLTPLDPAYRDDPHK